MPPKKVYIYDKSKVRRDGMAVVEKKTNFKWKRMVYKQTNSI